MENGTFNDQEGNTLHGTRDVTESAEFHWSELAAKRIERPKLSHMYRVCLIIIIIIVVIERLTLRPLRLLSTLDDRYQ